MKTLEQRVVEPDAKARRHRNGQALEGGPPETPVALRRVITLPWLILYGLGSTVGAGIYVLVGAVAGRAGLLAPLAFVLAALLALATARSFAELSARFPQAGGALVYVREGIGSNGLSVAVGLMTALAGIVSAATVSVGFVGYLAKLLSVPPLLALLFVVGGVGSLAAWGVRESVVAAGLVTLLEVAGLVAILVFGFGELAAAPGAWTALIPEEPLTLPWGGVAGAAVLGFYAFLGFEDMVNVAEEVREVRTALPRAILWTLGLSTGLYVLVATVAVLLVDPSELAASKAPLALVFERSGGSGELLSLIALAAMLNGALVQIVMASRILFSLARHGNLPRSLAWVHPKRRTPLLATLLVSLCVGGFASAFPLDTLATATASIALAVFSLVNLSLVFLLSRGRARGEAGEAREAEEAGNRALPIWIPALGFVSSLAFLSFELWSVIGTFLQTA